MLNKEKIQQKQKELKHQTELLRLSDHKALGDYIIVVPLEIDEPGITNRSYQFEDRPDIGLVVAVGPYAEEVDPEDVVFFGKYSHVKIAHDEIEYLIMRSEDIYCVVQK